LYHAFEIALDLGDTVVTAVMDLVFNGVYGKWQFGEGIVVWQLISRRKGEKLGSDWTATEKMSQLQYLD
jgi:hypothetical protein